MSVHTTPLGQLLRQVAGTGQVPRRSEITELPLSEDLTAYAAARWREQILGRCRQIAAHRQSGAHADARRLADDTANEFAGSLDTRGTGRDLDDLSPAELAAMVRR